MLQSVRTSRRPSLGLSVCLSGQHGWLCPHPNAISGGGGISYLRALFVTDRVGREGKAIASVRLSVHLFSR